MLSYELGSNNFTYNDTFGDMKFKNQQYYLEASSALLDVPEEWFYDINTGDSIFSIEDLEGEHSLTDDFFSILLAIYQCEKYCVLRNSEPHLA